MARSLKFVRVSAVLLILSLCLADDVMSAGTANASTVSFNWPNIRGIPISTCFWDAKSRNVCSDDYTPQVVGAHLCQLAGFRKMTYVRWSTHGGAARDVIQFQFTDKGVSNTQPKGTGIIDIVNCSE